MKFSATATLQYNTDFSPFHHEACFQALDWMKECGLDGAELCIANYEGVDIHRVKSELDKRGLGCSTISTGQARSLEGLSLIGVSADVTKKTQERLRQHIDAAQILGSKVTLGLMRGLGSISTVQHDLNDLSQAMLPIVDYAEKKGVVLLLESINRYETALLNSGEADLDFIENQLGGPSYVGILWDLFHANIEDISFSRSVDRMGKRLQHVHLADSNRMFPGYGHLDFEKILGYVKRSGFTEYCSFECFNKPSLETVLSETAGWVAKMRTL